MLLCSGLAGAQEVRSLPLVTLSSEAEARLRLSQLLGDSSGAGFLIRSPSRLSPVDSVHGSGQQFAIVLPR
ncbi:MAG TPA: hypothetical protein VN600_11970, partial [Gemmatimonadaceae bacterium]|nr:hypothetical protein [Gemmatimonadaceae bacterium]